MSPAPTALERTTNGRFRSPVGPNDRPAFVLVLMLVDLFVVEMMTGGPGRWGLSSRALSEGRFETLLTHMFSHGSVAHLVANAAALISFARPIVARVGRKPPGLRRFALLFLLSGLSGAAVFLVLNPSGDTPMVGASGAICGLWGGSIRLPANGWEPPRGLLDVAVLRGVRDFAISNAILFAILAVVSQGGITLAWEAHLGGLLFGLVALPAFLPKASERAVLPQATD